MASNTASMNERKFTDEATDSESSSEICFGEVFRPPRIRVSAPFLDAPTPFSIEETGASNNTSTTDSDIINSNGDDTDDSVSSPSSSDTEYVPDEDELYSSNYEEDY